MQERSKKGSDNGRDGRLQNVGEKIGNDMFNTEETPTPHRSEEYPRLHADPRDKGKKGKAREAGPRAEKKMADPVKEEVEDAAQPGENPKGRRFHPQDPPQKGKTIEEIEAGLQMEEKIDGLAKQGKDGVEAQMEESPNAKYLSPQDPPYKVEKVIDESKADIQVDEDVVDLAGQTAGIVNQPVWNLQDKRPPALLGPSQVEDTIEESEPELRVEEESSDLVEQEVEAASQAVEGPKDTHFPPQDLLEEEEIDESEADPQLDEEMADLAVEEGADQVQEDCEDPDQELEDSSAEQEVPLDEIESEIISALEAGTVMDVL